MSEDAAWRHPSLTVHDMNAAFFLPLKDNHASGADHISADLPNYSLSLVTDLLQEATFHHVQKLFVSILIMEALVMRLSPPFQSPTNRRTAAPIFDRSPLSVSFSSPHP